VTDDAPSCSTAVHLIMTTLNQHESMRPPRLPSGPEPGGGLGSTWGLAGAGKRGGGKPRGTPCGGIWSGGGGFG